MKTIFYLDTSVIAKLYFAESGSKTMLRLLKNQKNVFATSSLTYAELYATAHRLNRDAVIKPDKLEMVCQQFERDWMKFLIQEFSGHVRRFIPELAKNDALKGADSVHLASALFLNQRHAGVIFASSDEKLKRAVKNNGLAVFDPKNAA